MLRTILGMVVMFVLTTQPLLAATSDEFRVRLYGAEDTEPPTTPTILSVTPASDTQIDVVWSASTDNAQLEGYRIFRDSVVIATTTLTTYSDTGLTPSTTYSYEVQAFDWLYQYSSTSAAVATRTLATPVTPTPSSTPGSNLGSASGVVVLQDFSLTTDLTSARLVFETNRPARYVLRWGRTDLYDGGYIESDVYRFNHNTRITGLEPGTTYEYELIGYSPAGIPNVLRQGRFTTDKLIDNQPPANVWGLTAVLDGTGVRLWWQNPSDPDLAYVRILRNHLYYPIDVADGALVYQGSGEQVFDANAFAFGETQYYTVFTVDKDGNVSSGAVVSITRGAGTGTGPGGSSVPGELPSEIADVPFSEPVAFGTLDPSQIEVEQGSDVMHFGSALKLRSNILTLVRIPYEAVPERLKAIIVSFNFDTDGKPAQTYLLKINPDKTYYEARLQFQSKEGNGTTEVAVYDLEQSIVHYVRQRFSVIDSGEATPTDAEIIASDRIAAYTTLGILALLLILILLFLYWFFLAKDDDDDEEEDENAKKYTIT